MQVDLRTVERALAPAERVLDLAPGQRGLQRSLGEVPLLVRPELVVWPGRELDARLHPEQVVEDRRRSRGKRRSPPRSARARQKMCASSWVTCRTRSRPCSVPAQLVAVQRRGLRVPERQIPVAAQVAPEQEHVPRAIHRLQAERPVVPVRNEEHVVAELLPVPRGLPGLDVVDQRRLHLDVAAAKVLAAPEVLELVPDHHALWVPERRPRRVIREVEEVELRPEPPVVAPLRLLEPLEVGVEVGLRVEGRAVDPRQLLVLLVTAPVRAGEAR